MNPLLLVLAIVAGSLIVGGSAFFFLRARFRESIETIPTNVASGAAPNAVAAEVRAIGDQITRAMSEQQLQGETQRQLLTQKFDGVRQTVDAQRAHVEGLRNELRHEVRRRDAEMEDLRHQIGTIQTTVGLPAASMPALPPAPLAAPPEEPLADEPPALAESATESTPAFDDEPAFDDDLSGDSASGIPFVDVAQADPAQPPADSSTLDPFAALVFESAPLDDEPDAEADAATAFEYWTPDSPDAPTEPGAPGYDVTFEDVHDSLDAPESDAEPEIAPDTDHQPADDWEEASFDAPPAPPAALPAASGSVFDDVDLSGSIFQSVAFPPSPDAQRPSASHPSEATEQTYDDEATGVEVEAEPAASLPGDMHWVARPRASDPSPLSSLPNLDDPDDVQDDVQDDDPVTASAADFFSTESGGLAEIDDLNAFQEPAASGLIDLNTLMPSAPEPAAPLAAPVADLTPVPYPMPPADSAPPAPPATPTLPSAPDDDDRQPGTAPVPDGAEDLTVITSVTDDIQRLLYLEGVTTLEEIAQWGRTRARYIAVRVEVSEETILNQWVFEAQAAMFNQFPTQPGA